MITLKFLLLMQAFTVSSCRFKSDGRSSAALARESNTARVSCDGCTNCTQLADGSCVKRAAALSNMKDYHQLSKDERKLMMARLRLWAKVVHGKAMNYTCQNASVPRPLRQMGRRGYGTRDADSWHVCYDGWRPWVDGCTGVSIGIGGEWSFEDGLAQRIGCRLWAYDPTEQLAASHSKHAEMVSTHYGGRMKFDLIGLGGEVAQFNTDSRRYGKFDQSKNNIKTLGSILAPLPPIIDVLKIDCEGCEWTSFTEIAHRQPRLLSRVRMILLEVHSIGRYGMNKVTQVDRLLDFLINVHGFRVYNTGFNKGWPGARNQIKMPLVQAGFPGMPCCWLLSMMRPPSDTAWLAEGTALGG